MTAGQSAFFFGAAGSGTSAELRATADKLLVLRDGCVVMFGRRDDVLEAMSEASAHDGGTDTVPLRPSAPDNITQLSTAQTLADSIRRIFADDSVSEIFAGENQLF